MKIQQDRDLQLKLFVDLLMKQVENRHSDLAINTSEVSEFLRSSYDGLSIEQPPSTKIPVIIEKGTGTYTFSLDEKIHSLRRMKEALVITAEWLVSRGELHSGIAPIKTGKSRYLVAKTPVHRNDRNFDSANQLSNGLFLETNYSAIEYKRKVWELLEHFNHDKSLAVFSW